MAVNVRAVMRRRVFSDRSNVAQTLHWRAWAGISEADHEAAISEKLEMLEFLLDGAFSVVWSWQGQGSSRTIQEACRCPSNCLQELFNALFHLVPVHAYEFGSLALDQIYHALRWVG